MLTLCKIVLGPVLLCQATRLRRTALRLPEADGSRSGETGIISTDPLRLLFIGDSSAAGVGVETQQEALAYQTSKDSARLLNRRIRWRLIAKTGLNTREAMKLFINQKCEISDIVVIALGVNDVTSQRSTDQFIADYKNLLQTVEQRTGTSLAVVSGLPPMHKFVAIPQPLRWYLGRCAKRLNRALHNLCESDETMRFVPLSFTQRHEMARDGFHPGKVQYKQWAALVADQIVMLAPHVVA